MLGYPTSNKLSLIFSILRTAIFPLLLNRINPKSLNHPESMSHPSSSTSTNQKIAIFYPNFGGGGAESVCLWMLEALRKKYDLTLFTFSDVDIKI
jgi:hypothetical protein